MNHFTALCNWCAFLAHRGFPAAKPRTGSGRVAYWLLTAAMAMAGGCAGAHSSTSSPIRLRPDQELMEARRSLWTAWFENDRSGLAQRLVPEFVGLNSGDAPFSDRSAVMAAAAEFVQGGGRLLHIDFPETITRQVGDFAVLHSSYRFAVVQGGEPFLIEGRMSQWFVRQNGSWRGLGWHLDRLQRDTGGEPEGSALVPVRGGEATSRN